MNKRVVITGAGAVSPLGCEIDKIWQRLLNGESGVSKVERFDTEGLTSKIAGHVKEFEPKEYINPREMRKLDKFTQYGITAAKKAVANSGIEINEKNANRVAVIVSTGMGGMETLCNQYDNLRDYGARRVSPYLIPMMIPNILAGHISIDTGAKGPNMSIVTACATGTHSIGEGFKMIQRGDVDAAIVGGSEAPLIPLAVAGFSSMRALSTRNDDPQKASRPFDKDRDGFVIAEGAAVLVIETLESAQARGANIIAEIIGYGASGDAHHITAPIENGEGAASAMLKAINDAGIKKEDIQYVNAHGTSTPLNDTMETRAIKTAFGEHANNLYVNSTKSMTGHMLGAAGALEAIVTAKSLKNGVVHKTLNFENPGDELDLNYCKEMIKDDIQYAISNSFGFGGQNGVLVFKKYS